MTHPSDARLALFAGKDLGLCPRLRIAGHLRHCERCSEKIEQFGSVRDWLGETREEMPPGVNWDALALEMRANIRVGLAAGECVAESRERFHVPWRTPAVALPALLIILAGWILQSMHPPIEPFHPAAVSSRLRSGIVLEASAGGIGVEKDGRGLALLHPRGEAVVYSVRGDSLRSRYVDSDTGQVTISHVYAQ